MMFRFEMTEHTHTHSIGKGKSTHFKDPLIWLPLRIRKNSNQKTSKLKFNLAIYFLPRGENKKMIAQILVLLCHISCRNVLSLYYIWISFRFLIYRLNIVENRYDRYADVKSIQYRNRMRIAFEVLPICIAV